MNRRNAAERDLRAGDRLRGVLEHLLHQLRDEFGCKDEASARKTLAGLEREVAEAEEREETAWQEYRKAVGDGPEDRTTSD